MIDHLFVRGMLRTEGNKRTTAVLHKPDNFISYRQTRLALEVARGLQARLQGDCSLVELASLSDPELVPFAVGASLGMKIRGAEISAAAVRRTIDFVLA